MGLVSGFLNLWNYKVNGYIWEDEEKSQNYTLVHNPRTIATAYAYYLCQHVDGIGGDDIRRGGNPRWVWYFGNDKRRSLGGGPTDSDETKWFVGSDERKGFEQGYVNEGPTAEWSPNMSQLTSAIHASIVDVWARIAEDSSAGEWGAPP